MKIVRLVIAILIPLVAGFLGSIFTMPSIPTWYAAINKPAWNPPNWIFGPVWTILFILMGIALWLIWEKGLDKIQVRTAVNIFSAQLVLNIVWSLLFFGLHSPLWAFIEIIALWLMILWTIIAFYRLDKTAGLILIPYILWVSFASFLNFTVMRLNP
jgi:benzodiazapine receptor